MQEIAEAAWRCADPGVQFDTTINRWHTSPNSGRINASNPCFPADARVHTTLGLLPIGELVERGEARRAVRGLHPPGDRRAAGRGGRRHPADRPDAQRRQADRAPALRQRRRAALHAQPPDLDDQPRLRARRGADREGQRAAQRHPHAGRAGGVGAAGEGEDARPIGGPRRRGVRTRSCPTAGARVSPS